MSEQRSGIVRMSHIDVAIEKIKDINRKDLPEGHTIRSIKDFHGCNKREVITFKYQNGNWYLSDYKTEDVL